MTVGKILSKSGGIILVSLAIYSLLCTVYSDIIVQNDNDFLKLPYQSFSGNQISISMNDLIEEDTRKNTDETKNNDTNDKNVLYIFVLDISASHLEKKLSSELSDKYKIRLKSLQKKINPQIDIAEAPTRFDFAKIRLYEILVGFYENKKNFSGDEFAIWTLGNRSQWIFPKIHKKIKLEEKSIIEAINVICNFNEIPTENTDFADLFERLTIFYKEDFERLKEISYKPSSLIITFLSDLLHDVGKKKSIDIEENWRMLEEKIQQICNSNIMVNLIVSSDDNLNNQKSIFPLFRENIEWYRLNKSFIDQKKNSDFLFPVKFIPKGIKFYHEGQNYIPSSTVNIKSMSENNSIRVSLLEEINSITSPQCKIYCDPLDKDGKRLKNSKKLVSVGKDVGEVLHKDQMLRLTFREHLPSESILPILRLSVSNKKTNFLIPIIFAKILPKWAAGIFIILQCLVIITSLFSVVFFILSMILSYKKNRKIDVSSNVGYN